MMPDKIEMTPEEIWQWIVLGLEKGNYEAARRLFEDLVTEYQNRNRATGKHD